MHCRTFKILSPTEDLWQCGSCAVLQAKRIILICILGLLNRHSPKSGLPARLQGSPEQARISSVFALLRAVVAQLCHRGFTLRIHAVRTELHEASITRPHRTTKLVQLHCVASQSAVTADLAGDHGMTWPRRMWAACGHPAVFSDCRDPVLSGPFKVLFKLPFAADHRDGGQPAERWRTWTGPLPDLYGPCDRRAKDPGCPGSPIGRADGR